MAQSGWFVGTLCLVFLIVHGMSIVHGKSRLKDSRLRAVRGQILTKLGLTAPPEEHINITPTIEDLEAYNAVKNEIQKQHDDIATDCSHHYHMQGYFAKSVVSLPLLKQTGRTVHYEGKKKPFMVTYKLTNTRWDRLAAWMSVCLFNGSVA